MPKSTTQTTTLFIAITLWLAPLKTEAQLPYQQFPDHFGIWMDGYEFGASDGDGSGQGYWFYGCNLYVMFGDTIINNLEYRRIDRIMRTPPHIYDNSRTYFGGLREDTLSKYVYWIPPGDSIEYPIYYFGFDSVGDQAQLTYPSAFIEGDTNVTFELLSTSTTSDFGTPRNTYLVGVTGWGIGAYHEFNWIEGVGSSQGLFYFKSWPDDDWVPKTGGVNTGFEWRGLYHHAIDLSTPIDSLRCFNFIGLPSIPQSEVTLYPNPFNDWLTIDTKQNEGFENLQLSVYDITGRTVLKQDIIDNISVNMKELGSGTYIAHINEGNKRITTKVIVKGALNQTE